MLASILRTSIAAEVSVSIMRAFVAMRKYISNNLIEQKYINNIVLKNDERLTLVENTLNKLSEKQKVNTLFHDRFIIIDRTILYNCGSSFKDLGKKCFEIHLMEDFGIFG